MPRHDAERAESRLPSGDGAHRQRRRLRGHGAPLRAEHSGGSRRSPWRPAHFRRQEELRAAGWLGVDPERQVVVSRGHGHLLHAGHRQPAVRHGAESVGTPSRQHPAADPGLDARHAVQGRGNRKRLRCRAAAGVPDEHLCAGQRARSQDAVHVAVPVQRPA